MSETAEKPGLAERISSHVDGVVGIFSPKRAFDRLAYRRARGVMAGFDDVLGGKRPRSNWLPKAGSADSDILRHLGKLRAASRDLDMTTQAGGIIDGIVINTVGSGISPHAQIDGERLGLTDDQVTEFEVVTEEGFNAWVPGAFVEGADYYEGQALIDRNVCLNGDIFLLRQSWDAPDRPYSFCWQLIESDRVDTPPGMASDGSIRGGVEVGSRGEPIAYWVRRAHPGDSRISMASIKDVNTFDRYPRLDAEGRPNVIHLYFRKRVGQSRGYPILGPVIHYFHELASYMEAEVVAARVAACFAVLVKTPDVAARQLGRKDAKTDADLQKIQSVEPGMWEYLAPGEDITSINPGRPNAQADPFIERFLRMIAGSLNVAYETVAADFSKPSFAGVYAALLEARRFYKLRQRWYARKLCQPTWKLVLEEMYLRGELPDFVTKFYGRNRLWTAALHTGDGWDWLNPLQNARASDVTLKNDTSSEYRECRERGMDHDQILRERARSKRMKKKLGLDEKPTPSRAATETLDEVTENQEARG